MGIFGNNDEDDEDDPTHSAQAGDSGGGREIRQRVETLVDDLQAGHRQHTALVEQLDKSHEERAVAARALVRAALTDQAEVAPVSEQVIDRLTERELARPIAEKLLHSTADLHANGLSYAAVTEHALDALTEALSRLDTVRTNASREVIGGGASEVVLAAGLREYAGSVDGRRQIVVEATADAFEGIPRALARRAGRDPITTLVEMRTEQELGDPVGVETSSGELRRGTELAVAEREVVARLTDGIALAGIVVLTEGTVTQLGTLTGHRPYPE